MIAEHLNVNRVENGWVVTVYSGGASLTLVAKSIEEVTGFIKGIEWQTPRPINYGDMVAPTPPVYGGGSAQLAR